MTTAPKQQKREPKLPCGLLLMSLSLSVSCQTLRSTLPANAPAGGWCIVSWVIRAWAAALPPAVCRRVVRSFYAAFTVTTLLILILLLVSYTVMMLPFTLMTVYQFWYVVLILSPALILFVIFPFPLLVGYKMNYSIQNQVVKQFAHINSKLVRGIL
jgi:hypothetical protein